jgi:hypothetical protein
VEALCIGQMISQSPRSSNNNMGVLTKSNCLWNHIKSTNKDGSPKANWWAHGFELFCNLDAELSSRRHHTSEEWLWCV